MAKKKITRTWKIDPDIAKLIDECSEKTHLPKGDLVQLGAWIAANLSPDERQKMIEMMDDRKKVKIRLG